MTNLEKWKYYLKDVPSPEHWVELGWYYTVTAALQRRVWYYRMEGSPLFCNMYIVLIGPPATGKGLVLKPASYLLRYWARNGAEQNITPEANTKAPVRLFPSGPDTVTFEKLVENLANGTHRFKYVDGEGRERAYAHASMAFVLEELNALFQRTNDKVPKLMLHTFDCGDYIYETKNHSSNYVRNTCMSLLAGATPEILKEADKFGIFDDGFTSRTIFAFAFKPRHENFHIGDQTDDQIAAFHSLREWVKKLAGLFGQLKYDKECYDWLENWHRNENASDREGAGDRMRGYFARKRVNLLKLAAGVHFSESLSLELKMPSVLKAYNLLKYLEPLMSVGFSAISRNELHPISRDVLRFIRTNRGASEAEVIARFHIDATVAELNEILQVLLMSCECRFNNGKYYAN